MFDFFTKINKVKIVGIEMVENTLVTNSYRVAKLRMLANDRGTLEIF